jgi:DNA-binding NarL/FixJ family response regulator
MNILVCDDHLLLAEALSVVLRARGHAVRPPASRPDEAVAAVREHEIEVCVMDLSFPGADGVVGIRAVRSASPETHVVVLTGTLDPVVIGQAMAAGATTCVPKTEKMDRIVESIELAPSLIKPSVASNIVWTRSRPVTPNPDERLIQFLTTREREVLERLVAGQTTIMIAREMGVAYSTARTHIQSVLTKLGVHSKLAAVTFAARHGVTCSERLSETTGTTRA